MRYDADQRRARSRSPSTSSSPACGATRGSSTRACSSERLSADEARWRVPVPANGEATVTATFDTPLLSSMRAAHAADWRLALSRAGGRPGDRHVAGARPGRGHRLSQSRPRARAAQPAVARRLCAGQRDPPRAACRRGRASCASKASPSGIVPQSAIVTGLGEAVIEKNRDARLLSPGALARRLARRAADRCAARRRATGAVREQEAIVRATGDGVVLQTAEGFEALRCTGLPETLIAPEVPAGLSAKPTLSVRVRSPQAGRARRHPVLHHQQFRLAGGLCRRPVARRGPHVACSPG